MPNPIYLPQDQSSIGNIIAPAAQQTTQFLWNMLGQGMKQKYLRKQMEEQFEYDKKLQELKQKQPGLTRGTPYENKAGERVVPIYDANQQLIRQQVLGATPQKDAASKVRWEQLPDLKTPKGILKRQINSLGKIEYKEIKGAGEGGAGGLTPDQIFDNTTKLRGEFRDLSKDYIKVRDAFVRVVESASDPDPGGDLALIFNFMKVLDPGSVVRESEFYNAEISRAVLSDKGAPEVLLRWRDKILHGTRLTPGQRKSFVTRAKKLYVGQERTHKRLEGTYKKLSKSTGVNPAQVVIDFGLPASEKKLPEMDPNTTSVNPEVDRLNKKYGLTPTQ